MRRQSDAPGMRERRSGRAVKPERDQAPSAFTMILDDLVAACQPRRMTVVGDFTPRGGIRTSVTVTYTKP